MLNSGTARLAGAALRASARAYYAHRAANQIAAESELLQAARLDELQERQREHLALQDAQDKHHQEMLRIQQRSAWMTYRQTPDGQAFQEWCGRIAPVLDTFDRMNEEWLAAFKEIVRQSIPEVEWAAERKIAAGPASNDDDTTELTLERVGSYRGYIAFLPPDHKLRSKWRSLTVSWQEEKALLEEVRQHMHRQRVDYFGCDPVQDPNGLPPGWAVDDANWLIPPAIRSFIDQAYTSYPAPSEFPELTEWPPFVPLGEVKPPQLAAVIARWMGSGDDANRDTSRLADPTPRVDRRPPSA